MTIETFNLLMYGWIALAIILFPIQLKIIAPYGRHSNESWGKRIDNRLGWVLQEIVSPLVLAWFFLSGDNEKTTALWLFFALWTIHYFNRSLIFPFRTKTKGKLIPLMIVFSAIFFNIVNGWTNGYYLGTLCEPYTDAWLTDPRFIIGIIIFFIGAGINIHSDHILLNLRKHGDTGYYIPKGGFFKYISCPNHFGEIVEWSGFAIMCWNLPALGFAVWTAANLIPRAIAHHKWYKEKFEDYPNERKAVLPFLV